MKNGAKTSVAFIILFSIYISICILGVAQYRDVTVRYLHRFGGNPPPKKHLLCSVSFHLF